MVGLDVRRPILSREQRNDPVLGSTPHNCFRGLLFPPLAPPVYRSITRLRPADGASSVSGCQRCALLSQRAISPAGDRWNG